MQEPKKLSMIPKEMPNNIVSQKSSIDWKQIIKPESVDAQKERAGRSAPAIQKPTDRTLDA